MGLKHLKAYHELNEASQPKGYPVDTKISATTYVKFLGDLEKLISFPDLYNSDFYVWTCIINQMQWDDFDDNQYPPMTEWQYNEYLDKHEKMVEENPGQRDFDEFVGNLADHNEVEQGMPIKWYMEKYHQPKEIAMIMKMLADKSTGSFDIGFESI